MSNLIRVAPLLAAALFLGSLALLEMGRRIGAARLAADPEGAMAGVGAVQGTVSALVGLLIAFTIAGANAGFEARRQLIVEEANRISSAWQSLDLLPANEQPQLRELFRAYVDSRLETYRKVPDLKAAEMEVARSAQLEQQIWLLAVRATREPGSHPTAGLLLLRTLQDVSDIRTTRIMATRMHPPYIIFAMLAALTLIASTFVGYGMARGRSRNWLHMVGFAAVLTFTVYVIVDLEAPRLGLIRVDAADQMLVELRETMR